MGKDRRACVERRRLTRRGGIVGVQAPVMGMQARATAPQWGSRAALRPIDRPDGAACDEPFADRADLVCHTAPLSSTAFSAFRTKAMCSPRFFMLERPSTSFFTSPGFCP